MIQGSLSVMPLHQAFGSAGDAEGVFSFEQPGGKTLVAVRDRRLIWVSRGGGPLEPFDALVTLLDLAWRANGDEPGSFLFEPRATRDLVELGWPVGKVVEQVMMLADERAPAEERFQKDPLIVRSMVRLGENPGAAKGALQVAAKAMLPRVRRGIRLADLARALRADPVWVYVLARKLASLKVLRLEEAGSERKEEVKA